MMWMPKSPGEPWWRVVAVVPDIEEEEEEAIASAIYSVDHSRHGGPEFLILDITVNVGSFIVHTLCARWEQEGPLPIGRDIEGHLAYRGPEDTWHPAAVRLLKCPSTVHARYTRAAQDIALAEKRPSPLVLQVVLADEQGRWPWQPGCTRPQRLLGTPGLSGADLAVYVGAVLVVLFVLWWML